MRIFRMYLKGECMCETTLKNAQITLEDCLGNTAAHKTLQQLSEGATVNLQGDWTMQERM